MTAPLRVLFVCTANISRSPYAERRARQVLAGAPVTVASAGVPGYPGRGMDPEMAAQLRLRGAEPNGHISRSVTREILAESDLVLTFEFAQRMRLLDAWPEFAPRILGLSQFADVCGRLFEPGTGPLLVTQARTAARPDSMTWDVGDPYRQGADVARACADEIDDVLRRILPVLTGDPTLTLPGGSFATAEAAPRRALVQAGTPASGAGTPRARLSRRVAPGLLLLLVGLTLELVVGAIIPRGVAGALGWVLVGAGAVALVEGAFAVARAKGTHGNREDPQPPRRAR